MTPDGFIPGATAPAHPPGGPLPIPYTAREVGRTFADLLATFDFEAELHGLDISRFSFIRRFRSKRLLTALCIALWHIALEKSFPNDADAFFAEFLETWPPLTGDGRSAKGLHALVVRYDALVAEKKDADFSKVAEVLAEDLKIHENDRRRQQLRMSLHIRSVYELIFAKLI